MSEFVEIKTPHGTLGVRYGGSREEQPTELHVASAPTVKLGPFDHSLSFYMVSVPRFPGEERMWGIAVGSVKGRREGGGRNLSPSASDMVHGELQQFLQEWLTADSAERSRALALWCEQRARELDAEADRLDAEAYAKRGRATAFVIRAAGLRAGLEAC